MELWLGGRAQGKLSLAMQRYPQARVVDENELWEEFSSSAGEKLIWNHLHLFVKEWLACGKEPEEIWQMVQTVINDHPDLIILCDEIGNGIVPMEKEERRYREETGRLLCKIARQAESVERICCGIPVKIK